MPHSALAIFKQGLTSLVQLLSHLITFSATCTSLSALDFAPPAFSPPFHHFQHWFHSQPFPEQLIPHVVQPCDRPFSLVCSAQLLESLTYLSLSICPTPIGSDWQCHCFKNFYFSFPADTSTLIYFLHRTH